MIIGLGTDITEISRIKKALERFGENFCEKILTPRELLARPASILPFLAGRFAAKEAAVKALGTGFGMGIGPRHIEVAHAASGMPRLLFLGPALAQAKKLGVKSDWLSISHERNYATAVVVLEG